MSAATTKTTARKSRGKKTEANDASPMILVGDTGLKGYSGRIVDDPLTELHGRRGMEAYRRMADNSPILGAYRWFTETMLRNAPMSIEAAPESGDAGEVVRAFVESVYADMAADWEQHVGEVSSFGVYGWAACEPVFKVRRGDSSLAANDESAGMYASNYDDGKIGLADLAPRSQDSLDEWDLATNGEVKGMWQRVESKGVRCYLPAWKLYTFQARENKRSPEGRSPLRNAYTSQHALDLLIPLEGISAERDLAGLPHFELPAEYMAANAPANLAATRREYEDRVRALKQDRLAGLVTVASEDRNGKTGFNFKLVTSGGTNRIQLGEIIRRHESRILVSVLAEFLLIGLEKVGARAVAEPKTDMAMLALNAYKTGIARVHNRRVIPDLMRMNGIPRHLWPVMRIGDIEARSLVELGQYVSGLIGMGAIVPDRELERHLRELGDLPLGAVEGDELPEIDTQAPPSDAPGPDAGSESKQDTALNGAQVSSLLEIVGQVVNGQIPRDTGLQMMELSFGFDRSRADSLLGAAGAGFRPAVPPPTTEGAPSAPAPAPTTATTISTL